MRRKRVPMALAGGVFLACAVHFGARRPRAERAVAITSLIAGIVATGTGAALSIRTPSTLIEGTDITGPGREAGSLFLGAALPLLSYDVRLQLDLRRQRRPSTFGTR